MIEINSSFIDCYQHLSIINQLDLQLFKTIMIVTFLFLFFLYSNAIIMSKVDINVTVTLKVTLWKTSWLTIAEALNYHHYYNHHYHDHYLYFTIIQSNKFWNVNQMNIEKLTKLDKACVRLKV